SAALLSQPWEAADVPVVRAAAHLPGRRSGPLPAAPPLAVLDKTAPHPLLPRLGRDLPGGSPRHRAPAQSPYPAPTGKPGPDWTRSHLSPAHPALPTRDEASFPFAAREPAAGAAPRRRPLPAGPDSRLRRLHPAGGNRRSR